ncbi:hypothetical protein GGI24_004887, partial [Coemansia furcata]
MLIYKDIITDDELFSDAFELKEVGDIIEVDCAMISIKQGDVDTGANASAEGADEDEIVEDGAQLVNNVIYSALLTETSFDKKSYTTYIKGYLKVLKPKVVERAVKEAVTKNTDNPDFDVKKFTADFTKDFETRAGAFFMKALKNLKDYEFYVGASMNPDGM